jgi:malonyl CoA-acyl carrier protein transacylase
MITYAFAGQGSQTPGMGNGLFAKYSKLARKADAILGYSCEDLCRSRDGRLNRTEYTQPALFVVNALMYLEEHDRTGLEPGFLAGHSLGELNALHVAGVFDFELGLHIVKKRAELMSTCGIGGTMAALIGPRQKLLEMIDGVPDVWLALDNSPAQVVVSGTHAGIQALVDAMRRRNLGEPVPLPVSGAFHSPLMRAAYDEFGGFLSRQRFDSPAYPTLANVTGMPFDRENVPLHLANALLQPVRWIDCIRYLMAHGPVAFRQVGPGRAVSSLIRQIVLAGL